MTFLRNNSLSISFALLFLCSLAGQVFFGLKQYNEERLQYGVPAVATKEYLQSGHFIESTFENWESEFLQMGLFVVLTIFLQQKGSSESKDLDKEEQVDRQPDPARQGAPWAVRKGGWILKIYKHSLTICLFALFVASLSLHFYGSLKDENEQNKFDGKPLLKAGEYLFDSRFWFESFQNWQSEFLSVCVLIVCSIYLRQQGSAQSKPVDAPNYETEK